MTKTRNPPEFLTEAWPQCVPEKLKQILKKDPEASVATKQNWGSFMFRSSISAADYLSEIEARISRQLEGFFTIYEAADILEGVLQTNEKHGWVNRMQKAHQSGVLEIRHKTTRAPMMPCTKMPNALIPAHWSEPQERESGISDLVHRNDIDAWLNTLGVGYRFPGADALPTSPNPTGEKESCRDLVIGKILKKSALVETLQNEWPGINKHLSDASRNGLKEAAHAGKHGKWNLEKVRAWGESNGYLGRPTIAAPLHTAWMGPAKKHRIKY